MFNVIIPAETIVFIASSTLTLRYFKSPYGTSKRKPEVGLGVVGTNTFISFLFVFSISPFTTPVVKPSTQTPSLDILTSLRL